VITGCALAIALSVVGYRVMWQQAPATATPATAAPAAEQDKPTTARLEPAAVVAEKKGVEPVAETSQPPLRGPKVYWDEKTVGGIRVKQQVYRNPAGDLVSHGKYATFYLDGKPRNSGQLQHGKRLGWWKFWDEAGQLAEEQQFAGGLPHGAHRSFHANGRKQATGQFQQGHKNGEWLFWDEDGDKVRREFYQAGAPAGLWTHWNKQGKVWLERLRGDKGRQTPTPADQP